jgi:hypothetical protein
MGKHKSCDARTDDEMFRSKCERHDSTFHGNPANSVVFTQQLQLYWDPYAAATAKALRDEGRAPRLRLLINIMSSAKAKDG